MNPPVPCVWQLVIMRLRESNHFHLHIACTLHRLLQLFIGVASRQRQRKIICTRASICKCGAYATETGEKVSGLRCRRSTFNARLFMQLLVCRPNDRHGVYTYTYTTCPCGQRGTRGGKEIYIYIYVYEAKRRERERGIVLVMCWDVTVVVWPPRPDSINLCGS